MRRTSLAFCLVVPFIWLGLIIAISFLEVPLNARTDALLAGQESASSLWHYFYIAVDGALFVLLTSFVVVTARGLSSSPVMLAGAVRDD